MIKHYTISLALFTSLMLTLLPGVASSQELIFKLTGQQSETYEMGDHLFGFKDNALAGIDPLDTPEPPLPLGSYFAMAFILTDPQIPAMNRWRNDFRNPESWQDGIETWEMVFSTDHVDQESMVTIGLVSGDIEGMIIRLLKDGDTVDLTVPGQFSIGADEIGPGLILEIRSSHNLVTSISYQRLKCLFR